MNPSNIRSCLLLLIQRTLLGEVAPNLRAVIAEWQGKVIKVHFIFATPVQDEEREMVSCCETELIAAFDESFTINFIPEFKDPRSRITLGEHQVLAYHRAENRDYKD